MIWNIVVRRDPILLFFSSLYVSFEFRFEFLCMCVYTLLILLFASLFNVKTHTHTRKHTHSRFLSAFMRCFIYNHTIYRGVRTVFARSSVFFWFDSVCDEAKMLYSFLPQWFFTRKILLQLMTILNNRMVKKRVYCIDYHRNLQALCDSKKYRWHLLWWTQTTKIKIFHSKNVYMFIECVEQKSFACERK